MNNGLLLVGGAIALWLYSKVHTAQHLQFIPVGVSWDGGALHVRIGVQNPTSDSLQFNSLTGSLYINGANLGSIAALQPATIAPYALTQIELVYTPNLLTGIPALLSQLINGVSNLVIGIAGTANINSVGLPVNITFQPFSA